MWAGDELIIDFGTPFDGDDDDVAFFIDTGRADSFATID